MQSENPQVGPALRKMIERLNELSPFATASGVLDNGCGSGAVISYILDTFGSEMPSSSSILAADFSEHMLEKVRETKQARVSKGKEGWDRLELRNVDAHDLSAFHDGSVSHVTGGHLYFLLDDPQKALKETYRILSAGGVLATSGGSWSQHLDALQDAVEVIRPGTNLRLIRPNWATEAGVKNELETAGFGAVETFLIESEMQYKTHEDMASTLLVMPVMKNAVEGYDENEKARLHTEVVKNMRSKNPAEPGVVKGASIVALGRKN